MTKYAVVSFQAYPEQIAKSVSAVDLLSLPNLP